MGKKKIIIVGAGFAGLQLGRKLKNNPYYEVTIIDKFNFHQFQPLFYQVATARIEPSSISFPLRKVFQGANNVSVRIAEVEAILSSTNQLKTNIGTFDYDYLVLATGCTTNFFGNQAVEEYAFPMKTTMEAIAIQNRLLTNFERALTAPKEDLEGILNIVVVGGGPTGVEMSGAIAEMKRNILPKDYPDMNFSSMNIFLLEGGPHLLGPMSDMAHQKSKEYLESMGVNVWTNALFESYDGKVATLKDGRQIVTENVIWAAGVKGNIINGIQQDIIQRGNRILVDRYNKVQGTDNIFAIGDIAYMTTDKYPNAHPQLANVAINQAKNLHKNFDKLATGNSNLTEFEYADPGSMATVGKRKAVVDLPKFSFQGRFAWYVWMFLHLMLILSVKNKIVIFINWAISYFTNDTTLRLIMMPTKKHKALADQGKFKF